MFDFGVVLRDLDWVWRGLANTALLVVISLVVSLPLGLPIALWRMSRFGLLSLTAKLYLDLMRTVPTVVLLFWVYFALPLIVSIRMGPIEAAAATLILQYSAYFAEIFRGGIQSIERGQWEAARALGMTRMQQLRKIILPQATRRMISPIFNHVIELVKTTSIASSISFAELVFEGNRMAAETFRPVEVFTVVAVVYFVILFSMGLIVRRLEDHLHVAER